MMKLPVKYDDLTWQEKREVREEYIKRQKGLCYYCNKNLNASQPTPAPINWSLFPPNFLKYPVHLHHNHDTGYTLGAVHNICNAYLWQYLGE